MKKISLFSVIVLSVGIMSCGSKSEPKKDVPNDSTQQTTPVDTNTTSETGSSNQSIDPNSSPENVVKTMIEAGKTGNYEQLAKLCNPKVDSDGDAKDVCALSDGKGNGKEYNDFFGNASITGAARIKGNQAEVDIKTTAEGGETETINVVQLDGKWYLQGF